MPLEFSFTCPLSAGIHARPASCIEEVARQHSSSVTLTNARTGAVADGKSVLLMVGADIRFGDSCRVGVEGPDENVAFASLKHLIESDLPRCDSVPQPAGPEPGQPKLPVSLRHAGVPVIPGTPAVGGIGRGILVLIDAAPVPEVPDDAAASGPEEWRRICTALAAVRASLERKLSGAPSPSVFSLLKAHLSIARDPALASLLQTAVLTEGCSAAASLRKACERFSGMLRASDSAYLRERVLDVRDVCDQIMRQVYGDDALPAPKQLHGPSIVAAEAVAPSRFLSLDRRLVRGLALGDAGMTSHTVILARAEGIPVLTGVSMAAVRGMESHEIILDADIGAIIPEVTPAVERYYRQEAAKKERRSAALSRSATLPGRTSDGVALEVGANVATVEEAASACARGADGIGLFRTEMLFMDRSSPPDEEEQYGVYRRVVEAAAGRPVVFRTIDVGGDKPLPYAPLPPERNPFLGYRGVRIYREFAPIVKTQLRALARASAGGKVRVMIPMVSRLEEVRLVRGMVDEVQAGLRRQGVPFDPSMELGIMVEVPSVAFQISRFCREVDFFSIGTNDLTQYFLAADRGSAAVSELYDPHTPSFIELLSSVAHEARAHGRWIGVCGEFAGDARSLPLIAGIGVDEISVSPNVIPEIKANLPRLNAGDCRALADAAARCTSPDEARALLAQARVRRVELPLLDPDLIIADSDSSTKEEVIKTLCDALFLSERTDVPGGVEEAVWRREEVFSTALGYGFAVPHCKTDLVMQNTIALLKPSRPVKWNGPGGEEVKVVVLLASRETDTENVHMKVFAQLARKIMHEEFREALIAATDPGEIQRVLAQGLGLGN